MTSLSHITARAFDTPLLIDAGKAEAIALGLGARMLGGAIEIVDPAGAVDHVAGGPQLAVVGARLGRAYDARGLMPFDVIDGVAVIPIEGTLVHKGGYIGSYSGQTSYEGLQTQVRRAARSEHVKGVVFEVDSYGGESAGAFDTADMIAELSAIKPTIAILTDVAFSGGYLLASAARQIIAPEFGRAGSIGVVMMHVDHSRRLANAGIKVTLITAGKRKAEGVATEPLADETRQRMQANADRMWRSFAERIGRYRAGRFSADQAMATEAGTFDATEAVSLGMVDAIGPADAVFAEFIAAVNATR